MNAIVLSATSDIGARLVESLANKGYNVFGTYNTTKPNRSILPEQNLIKLNIKDFNSTTFTNWLSEISTWELFISCIGTQEPVGRIEDLDPKDWVEGVTNNSTNQIAALMKALPYRKKNFTSNAIFFAGGGTNNATPAYSAQTLGKIALIKAVELIDYEIEDLKCTILGPGWVKTKIHAATLKAKANAGMNYKKTINMLNSPQKLNTIEKVLDDIYSLISLPKELVGGRNFSSVYDILTEENLRRLFEKDKDFYRLRRNLNNS